MIKIDVVIGTTVVRKSSFALDHFLRNLYEIQSAYSGSVVVIATDEPDFAEELNSLLKLNNLFGQIIMYKTEIPDYTKNFRLQTRLWSITSGRNAIRKYVLNSSASYLLFLDADMTYDPQVVNIMKGEIDEFDVVQSGYILRSKSFNALGFGGCTLIKRDILSKIKFRFCQFESDHIIEEFNMFELDLFKVGGRIKKGIFLNINHYLSHDEIISINPSNLSLFQKVTTWPFLRYVLLHVSIVLKYNIGSYLQRLVYKYK